MSKKIYMTLDTKSINKAIREVETYKREIEAKTTRLAELIAERLRDDAQSVFDSAIVDDLTERSGGAVGADVTVEIESNGNIQVVIARGEDAIWVEFGAGVHHNGAVGQSPHPLGSELKYVIGGFGKGHGKRDRWHFKKDGSTYITYGTPAKMPMYNAMMRIVNDIESIAKEVFSQ